MSICDDVRDSLEDIDYCLKLLRQWGVRDDEEISAALLEVAESLQCINDYDSSGRKRSKSEVLSYICTRVRRCIYTMRRNNAKEVRITDDIEPLQIPDDEDDLDGRIITSVIVDSLPRKTRRVVILSMMGFTSVEVEKITGVTRGMQYRDREKAQRKLSRYYKANWEEDAD